MGDSKLAQNGWLIALGTKSILYSISTIDYIVQTPLVQYKVQSLEKNGVFFLLFNFCIWHGVCVKFWVCSPQGIKNSIVFIQNLYFYEINRVSIYLSGIKYSQLIIQSTLLLLKAKGYNKNVFCLFLRLYFVFNGEFIQNM